MTTPSLYWTLLKAKERASRVHPQLQAIPLPRIMDVLKLAMEYYFQDATKYRAIEDTTGSPTAFIQAGMEYMKDWCRNLDDFHNQVFHSNIHTAISDNIFRSTAPVVAVLPSNSEQESIYVIVQILLSRNAGIVRPSSQGCGAFACQELTGAINTAVDELNDESLGILKEAITIVRTDNDYIQHLAVKDWNYLLFGSDVTLKSIEAELRSQCAPRKVIKYGTGLSTSIVLNDYDQHNAVKQILDSVSVNAGNECVSTDIIYIDRSIYDEVLEALETQATTYLSREHFNSDSIGITHPNNLEYVQQEVCHVRGKSLNLDNEFLHLTLLPLHEYETAMEYPAPIVSIRSFENFDELSRLIQQDLNSNGMKKNLVTSIYTQSPEHFSDCLEVTRAYQVKHNKGSHEFNITLPHQGVHLLQELVDVIHIDNKQGT